MMTATAIFADNIAAYLDAGWSGVLPLPPRAKSTPPEGFTGTNGGWPSAANINQWRRTHADGNIALRLPRDVIGVDMDLYKEPGAREALETIVGPLPPTWCSTSRVDGSGIRFYRVPCPPSGTVWRDTPVPGVEIIQHHHRYAVVWPSLHPEGRTYLWVDEASGEVADRPPEIDELTELPWTAITALTRIHDIGIARAPINLTIPAGNMSVTVERRLVGAIANTKGDQGSRHAAAVRDVVGLLRFAERGEPGVEQALRHLRDAFVAAVAADRPGGTSSAEAEFDNMLRSGISLVASTEGRIPTKADRDYEASGAWLVNPHPDIVTTFDPTVDLGTIEFDELIGSPDEPYDWLIEGLIERGDRVILTGLEGRGKSTFLRQFAIKAASGIHPFTDEPGPAINVLYLDCENSRRQVRRKVTELRAAAGTAYHHGHLNFVFRPDGIDLTRTQDVAWLTARIEHHQPDLVVAGPIYKMSNGDPKDEQDAKAVASALDYLRTTYGHALFMEAHTPYADGGKSKRPERPYGASLWSRWPEFGIFLGPEGDLLHWRGQRDERAWPKKVARSAPWPWAVTEDDTNPEWEGPTHCMQDIVALLSASPETEFSTRQLTTTLRANGLSYKDKTIALAAESAAVQGLVKHRTGARNARLYRANGVGNESQEPIFDDRGPPRPTAAHRGPAAVEDVRIDRGPPRPEGGTTYPPPWAAVDEASKTPTTNSGTHDRGPAHDALFGTDDEDIDQ